MGATVQAGSSGDRRGRYVGEARGSTQKDPVADRCLELCVWDLELPEAFLEPHGGWQPFVEA